MLKNKLAPIVCRRREERNRRQKTRRQLLNQQGQVPALERLEVETRHDQSRRHRSQNRLPVEAIQIAGSTPSAISRWDNPTNQHVQKYHLPPHHAQIEAGQSEKGHGSHENRVAPAIIVKGSGNRVAPATIVKGHESRVVLAIIAKGNTVTEGLVAIAVPATIAKEIESVTAPVPIM